jgi:hypothetical protein
MDKVDGFWPKPTKTDQPKGQRGRPPKYDWDLLTNGEVWSGKQGIDFTARLDSFRIYLHEVAAARGLKVKTATKDDEIRFQFRRV